MLTALRLLRLRSGESGEGKGVLVLLPDWIEFLMPIRSF